MKYHVEKLYPCDDWMKRDKSLVAVFNGLLKNLKEIIMKDNLRTQVQKDFDWKFFEEQKTSWRGIFLPVVDKKYSKKWKVKHERQARFVSKPDAQIVQVHEKFNITSSTISSNSTNSSFNSPKNDKSFVTNYFSVQKSREKGKKRSKSRISEQPVKKVF